MTLISPCFLILVSNLKCIEICSHIQGVNRIWIWVGAVNEFIEENGGLKIMGPECCFGYGNKY